MRMIDRIFKEEPTEFVDKQFASQKNWSYISSYLGVREVCVEDLYLAILNEKKERNRPQVISRLSGYLANKIHKVVKYELIKG